MCASVFVSLSFLCMFIKLNLPLFWITTTYYHHVMIHKVKGPWDIANKSKIKAKCCEILNCNICKPLFLQANLSDSAWEEYYSITFNFHLLCKLHATARVTWHIGKQFPFIITRKTGALFVSSGYIIEGASLSFR